MSPSDNIRAKSFANEVTRSAKLLRDPNVAKQLNGDWAAKGNTVGELIDNMNRTGQKFGPAGPADRPYYFVAVPVASRLRFEPHGDGLGWRPVAGQQALSSPGERGASAP